MGSSTWTTADIPDQTGRTIVVTGANSGLGLHTTDALTRAGATVIMACRDLEKAESAKRWLALGDRTEILQLDLADVDAVHAAADRLDGRRIDVLVNNAGLMNIPFARTPQGHEMQFGVNVVGHFALTRRLVPQLTDRVVWLGSLMHRFGSIDLRDLYWRSRKYSAMSAYGASKLACVMLAYEQQRRFEAEHSPLRAMAAHPGYSATNLQERSGSPLQNRVMSWTNKVSFIAQDAATGALPELYAATVRDLPGGSYIGPDGPFELSGRPLPVDSTEKSKDREVAAQLWARLEETTAR